MPTAKIATISLKFFNIPVSDLAAIADIKPTEVPKILDKLSDRNWNQNRHSPKRHSAARYQKPQTSIQARLSRVNQSGRLP